MKARRLEGGGVRGSGLPSGAVTDLRAGELGSWPIKMAQANQGDGGWLRLGLLGDPLRGDQEPPCCGWLSAVGGQGR